VESRCTDANRRSTPVARTVQLRRRPASRRTRAAVLAVAAELASSDDAGLVRVSDLARDVVARSGFSVTTVMHVVARMAGRGPRAYSDFERVRKGVYRLRPSAGVLAPRRASCKTAIVDAVRRISAASPDACAHIDAIREALSGTGYTPATIKTTLRRLATGEHGGWLALERVGRGRYRLRRCGRSADAGDGAAHVATGDRRVPNPGGGPRSGGRPRCVRSRCSG
jgi:hypothetical protein